MNRTGKWMGKLNKGAAWLLIMQLLTQPAFAAATEVVGDPANGKNPGVTQAANGTTVVQIVAPNAAGLSHNQYLNLQVGPGGIIYNNGVGIINTKLAGYITGNPNLAGGSARIILNEVTGKLPTQLNGFQEVAGQRADLILANPNGIVGNNFGFINVNRGVLTTGTPLFGGSGSLDAFRVTGGQIAINGSGFDASGADRVDLIARSVQLNAQLNANELNVITGANQVNYATNQTVPISAAPTDVKPAVALDVSALGGMYANKITLVGTESGVGVNSQGVIQASGDIQLTQAGKINLGGKTVAGGQIKAVGQSDMTVNGSLYAANGATAALQGTLNNAGIVASGSQMTVTANAIQSNGTFAAGLNPDGSVKQSGDLTLTATGQLAANGKNVAGGNLMATAETVDVSKSQTQAGAQMKWNTTGDLNASGAQMTAGTLDVKTGGTGITDGGVISAGRIALQAGSLSNKNGQISQSGDIATAITVNGTLDNSNGTIRTNGGDLLLTTGNLDNSQGKIVHAGVGELNLRGENLTNQRGQIAGNGAVNATMQRIDNRGGSLAAQQELHVNAQDNLDNSMTGVLKSGVAMVIASSGQLQNQQGLIESNRGIELNVGTLNNDAGRIAGLDGSAVKIGATGQINNGSGLIGGNGAVSVSAANYSGGGTIQAATELNINAQQQLANSGNWSAARIWLQGAGMQNSGVIEAQRIDLNGLGSLANRGALRSIGLQDWNINLSGNLDNNGGTLAANSQNFSITATNINNQQGTVQHSGSGTLSLHSFNIDNRQGRIASGGNVTVTADSLDNRNAAGGAAEKALGILAGAEQTVNVGALENQGGQLQAGGNLQIAAVQGISQQAEANGSKQGGMQAGANLIISSSAGAVTLTGTTRSLSDSGIISLNANTGLTNLGTLRSETELDLTKAGGRIDNQGVIESAKSVTVATTQLTTGANSSLQAGVGKQGKGNGNGQGPLTMNADSIDNQGEIKGDAVSVTAKTVTNSGSLFANQLIVNAENVTNQGAKAVIASVGDVELYVNNVLTNQDQAMVYSENNIVISSKKEYGKTKNIINDKATISAQKDINIKANCVENKSGDYVSEEKVVEVKSNVTETDLTDKRWNELVNTGGRPWNARYLKSTKVEKTTIMENIVKGVGKQAEILGGQNIFLEGEYLNNDLGKISAGNRVELKVDNVNNKSIEQNRKTLVDTTTTYLRALSWSSGPGHQGDPGEDYDGGTDTRVVKEHSEYIERLNSYASVISGNQQVTIQAMTLNNKTTGIDGNTTGLSGGGVSSSSLQSMTAPKNILQMATISNVDKTGHFAMSNLLVLPTSGLYIVNMKPSSSYLVETNSKFTSFQTFVSSDDVLNKLGIDPTKSDKRIGDGFYEQKLIRDQVSQLSGKRYLNGYSSDNQQYSALMDNAINQKADLKLELGIALTPEQIANLKKDIVWMVKQEVAGQMVLVPQVYLANNTENLELKNSGALVAGGDVRITVTGDVSNSGSIHAERSTSLTAANILNKGGRIAGDTVTLDATSGSIVNQSGVISGGDVSLTAKQDIKNETLTTRVQLGETSVDRMEGVALIQSTRNLNLSADKNITLTGGQLTSGADATVAAKGDLTVNAVQQELHQAYDMGGGVQVRHDAIKQTGTAISAGGKVELSGNNVALQGTQLKATNDVKIIAANSETIGGLTQRDSRSISSSSGSQSVELQIENGATIKGNNVQLKATNDMTLNGTQVDAKGTLDVSSEQGTVNVTALQNRLAVNGANGANVAIAMQLSGLKTEESAVMDRHGTGQTYQATQTETIGGQLKSGGDLTLTAAKNIALQSTIVKSDQSVTVTAGGNVDISAGKDTQSKTYRDDRGDEYYHSSSYDETVRGSSIVAGKDLAIHANGGNLTITSSAVATTEAATKNGNGNVTLHAAKDVKIQDSTEVHDSLVESRTVDSGFFSTTVTEKRDHNHQELSRGSIVGGSQIKISAGNALEVGTDVVKSPADVTVKASTVIADNSLTVAANRDIKILSGQDATSSEHFFKQETSGLFSGGGLGFTIGKKSEKLDSDRQTITQVGSTLGANNGKVTLTSGRDVTVTSSNVSGQQGVDLTAEQNVNINAANDSERFRQSYEFKQSGLSVSLGGGLVSGVQNTINTVQSAANAKDSRLQALEAWQAGKQIQDIGDKLKDGWAGARDNAANLNVSISFGSQRMTTQSESQSNIAHGSSVNGGKGDVNITANKGDLNVIASNVSGNNVKLDAKEGDVNLLAGENTSSQHNSSSSSSTSIGVSIGFKGGITPSASFSRGTMDANGNIITHTDTLVSAKENLTINSGNDTNLVGAKASGDKIVATVGRNLNVVSLQDSDTYHETSNNIGLDLSLGKKLDKPLAPGVQGPVKQVDSLNATGSFSRSKIDSDYNSVTQQSGLYAGKGGFDITVTKNTDLKGAVIDSNATPDKNKLTTGTLTWSDIHNKAAYEASSFGVAYDSKKYQKTDTQNYKNQGLTPVIGPTVSGKADSTTTSAIALGTIEIKDKANQKQDLSTLSRDSKQSINALGKIFDKQTVQEQQQLIKLFGEVAYDAVGNMNLKEGSSEKAAVDMVVGGIMSQLGGGGFGQGAAAAGFSQLAMTYIMKIKDPAMQQWVSALIGAVASDLTGGNGNVGAFIALSQIRNNYLNHRQLADNTLTQAQRELLAKRQDVLMDVSDVPGEEGRATKAGSLTPAARAGDGKYSTEIQDAINQRAGMVELANCAYVTGKINLDERNSIVERMDDETNKIRNNASSFSGLLSTMGVMAISNVPLSLVADNVINPTVLSRGDLSSIAMQKVFDPENQYDIMHQVELREQTSYIPTNAALSTPSDGWGTGIGAGIVILSISKKGNAQNGFDSFRKLKNFLGSPGEGNQWHHIVEQAQQNAARAGFSATEINTVENVIALQSGKGSVHEAISGYYSSKQAFTNGLTVRDWLATKSFQEQFEFGMNQLKKYGDIIIEDGRWVFKEWN